MSIIVEKQSKKYLDRKWIKKNQSNLNYFGWLKLPCSEHNKPFIIFLCLLLLIVFLLLRLSLLYHNLYSAINFSVMRKFFFSKYPLIRSFHRLMFLVRRFSRIIRIMQRPFLDSFQVGFLISLRVLQKPSPFKFWNQLTYKREQTYA